VFDKYANAGKFIVAPEEIFFAGSSFSDLIKMCGAFESKARISVSCGTAGRFVDTVAPFPKFLCVL
jgi:hypothetical protein